jgi:hypothetical protein
MVVVFFMDHLSLSLMNVSLGLGKEGCIGDIIGGEAANNIPKNSYPEFILNENYSDGHFPDQASGKACPG